MDEVELLQDGKSLGRQKIDKDGHLVWNTTYRPGKLEAKGYRNGKKIITEKVETTTDATQMKIAVNKQQISAGSQDVVVADITLFDKKGRFVPNACEKIMIEITGDAEILGWGNGDPGFKTIERPQGDDKKHLEIDAFMGQAQVLLRSSAIAEGNNNIELKATLPNQATAAVIVTTK